MSQVTVLQYSLAVVADPGPAVELLYARRYLQVRFGSMSIMLTIIFD